jgi:hypothetical protein
MITRQVVRDQIVGYLNRRITLQDLVSWAENSMDEGELDPQDEELLRDIVARIGVADVQEFGLSWDELYDFLSRLGYKVQVMAA